MKKVLLATAIAALSVSAAQAAPTLYGKAFLTLDLQDGSEHSLAKDSRTQLKSNGSRIGLKGSEALTTNTDLVYQLEYGVRVDDNTDTFKARDTYLGLANKQYGTVVAGRLSAVDGTVDYANVTKGGVIGGDNVLAAFDSPRVNNTIAYFSPERNGVQVFGAYVMDETKGSVKENLDTFRTVVNADGTSTLVRDTKSVPNKGQDSLGRDAFQIGAKYEVGQIKAGAAYTQAGDRKIARVSGAYALNKDLTVGALVQTDKGNAVKFGQTAGTEKLITVSAKLKTATPWTAYGQVDLVDNAEGVQDAEAQRLVVGGEYAINKNTTGHVYGAYKRDELKAANVTAKDNSYGIGAGLEYKF
ncbi:porin [Moraxella nasovis]|uniref:porin n=1 Tax=Moraxella nasovis TaxID=2904121 RepID=UPI001F6118FD|nr:porin [Moraxella nasovis]UNU73002.1 porin [Moraxella nasovis]